MLGGVGGGQISPWIGKFPRVYWKVLGKKQFFVNFGTKFFFALILPAIRSKGVLEDANKKKLTKKKNS